MWKITYNVIVHALFPVFALTGLAKKKVRANFTERLYIKSGPVLNEALWIHAASIGEAVIAENVVRYMRSKTEQKEYLITTNTYYTKDLLTKRLGGDVHVCSMPFDLPISINRFMKRCTFRALVLVETELWPNLLWTAHKMNIPIIIVNGRLSDATIGRYRRFSFFLREVLSSVTLVLAQSSEHARRFVSVGMDPSRVVVTGNLKYYRFMDRAEPPVKQKAVTFGSIKERELPLILPLVERLRQCHPQYTIYVVPREISLIETVVALLSQTTTVARYSGLRNKDGINDGVVVVDTVGDLMNIYARSELAFVGGSLAPYGGQNILEPLFFGTPVLFGPYIDNFKEIGEAIVVAGAGIMVKDGEELARSIETLVADAGLRDRMGEAGRRMIEEQEGVMAKTATLILEALWKNSRGS